MTMTLLAARDLRKTYRLGRVDVPVLRGATLSVSRGEWVAVLGASGSGKSTLLHLMGGLDRPDRKGGGSITYDGRPLDRIRSNDLDRYRAADVGFVFQFYHLLPEFTVLENVLAAAMILHGRFGFMRKRAALEGRARELLAAFGLPHRLGHRPAELSGGERQRVAIARALMNQPALLLADEPTGNLDRATGETIIAEVARLRERTGQTIVMVTHDPEVAARADRIVHLRDGRVGE
ncbi:MAG: ABC transporter ATP-binding protein [Phycisphaerales bacterium]|nr:ABC transporter ATP-binding protein [Phycisphaerales bacterium]